MGDRTSRNRWRAGWRKRTGLWLCALLWTVPVWGCFSTHGPQDSTETGNPPVLDIRRVALKVNAGPVHVMGDKGAVTPGGATIEITNLTTGLVTTAKANADGSFDVQVGGSPDEAFVVRASTGTAKSTAVYVVRGSAVVGTGKNDALSCEQRDQLAGAQLQLAATSADKHCLIDSDCRVALEVASCHDRCQYAIVSQQGKDEIDATGATIDAGLCSSYAQDGCMNVLLPCVSPPAVKCVLGPSASSGGQCVQADAPAMLSCRDRDQMAGQQIFDAVRNADRSCTVDADCVTASPTSVCHDSCGLAVGAVSQAGKASIDAAVAIVDTGLCGTFVADGCTFEALPCAPVGNVGSPRCTDGQCMLSQ